MKFIRIAKGNPDCFGNLQKKWLLLLSICFFNLSLFAFTDKAYVTEKYSEGSFTLISKNKVVPLFVNQSDYKGVLRAVNDLQADFNRVIGILPEVSTDKLPVSESIVIIGTLGHNALIDKLAAEGRIDISSIKGKWESFIIQAIQNPVKGINNALIIAGSDKRGTIYGIYDLSEQMGVSPWYWWADVPVRHKDKLYVLPGQHTMGEPAVKYRGIFINDEAPALSEWVYEKFGGFNHLFYENVFELILRLKGNYLWPAMWGHAFYDDDSLNAKLANEYGVVIGTSHHEPLMRAHDEWRRYGSGPWNYDKNAAKLQEFWKEGIRRMDDFESIVTIGMRGDGDEPMTQGTAIALLERIVKDQRQIIGEVTGKDPSEIPQDWALYKEVQDYYDKGMRVPDDVTLLLCDDNWGNIRRLPKPDESSRKGGYGIYYHYDYVGGPRNYKWVNTNEISRVWEQMHLAYEHGVDHIWIVNVGDIKPMEFPIQFFLDYAWNPDQWPANGIPYYTRLWARQQFGSTFDAQIADLMIKYAMYNSRRKPELLSPETYSLTDYNEAERVTSDYNKLNEKAASIGESLPEEYRDAYYQLVLHPIEACSNLNNLYVTIARNHLYASQGRAATNDLANEARILFANDSAITHYYNKVMANGKWDHMMDQTHIGYTSWQEPPRNIMPEVDTIIIPDTAEMGVAIEGSANWWPKEKKEAVLPAFDRYRQQARYVDIFNRGSIPFDYRVTSDQPWVSVSQQEGKVEKEKRVEIRIDWFSIPDGDQQADLTILGPYDSKVIVHLQAKNPASPKPNEILGFVEANGYVSIEAEHFSSARQDDAIHWQIIPGLGRTLSGVTAMPTTLPEYTPGGNSPRLEYPIYFFTQGKIKINVYISPTMNYYNDEGLKYGISIDDEPPQIVRIHANDTIPDWKYPQVWNQSVSDNIRILTTNHFISVPGEHTLKIWMVTPGVVLQKIVIDTGNLKPSYLGPPESFYQVTK
jgi:hypothetical protein